MIYPLFYDLTRRRIHIDPKAQALIEQVDPAVMAGVVADFPADVPALPILPHHREWYAKMDKPPRGDKLKPWLDAAIRAKTQALEIDLDRYHALRDFGPLELSLYDLTISSSSPYCGVATALRLKTAHVMNDRHYLAWYAELKQAVTTEDEKQPALF